VLVENGGVGIPPEMRERIFTRSSRPRLAARGWGCPSRGRSSRPTAARSPSSDGLSETTFIVELPTTAPVMAARSPAVSERILITEDDEDLAFVIREALTRQATRPRWRRQPGLSSTSSSRLV
jgi:hypothetical protein